MNLTIGGENVSICTLRKTVFLTKFICMIDWLRFLNTFKLLKLYHITSISCFISADCWKKAFAYVAHYFYFYFIYLFFFLIDISEFPTIIFTTTWHISVSMIWGYLTFYWNQVYLFACDIIQCLLCIPCLCFK